MTVVARGEAEVFDKEKLIAQYSKVLSDTNEMLRATAIWHLSNIQSSNSIAVLMQHVQRESALAPLQELYFALSFQLQKALVESIRDGGNDTNLLRRNLLRWKTEFEKLGYEQCLRSVYSLCEKSGKESTKMYIISICERYDPMLCPLLLELFTIQNDPELKALLQETILCWSGLNIGKISPSDAKRLLRSPEFLSNPQIAARIREFLKSKGYGTLLDNVVNLTSGLFVVEGETERRMFFRLAMDSLEKIRVSK